MSTRTLLESRLPNQPKIMNYYQIDERVYEFSEPPCSPYTKLTKVKGKKALQQQAVEDLRLWLPFGAEVYTLVKSVSKTGMSRQISLYVVQEGSIKEIDYFVARALNRRRDKGIRINGCGMDMGYALVYELGRALFQDEGADSGYGLRHRWL